MKNHILIITLLLFLSWSLTVHGEDKKPNFCKNYKLDKNLEKIMPYPASISKEIVEQFCSGILNDEPEVAKRIYQLSVASEKSFENIDGELVFPINEVNKELKKRLLDKNTVPNFNEMPSAQGIGIKFSGKPFKVAEDKKEACEQLAKENQCESCREYIHTYYKIYSHAQMILQKLDVDGVTKYLNIAESDWENYYTKGRSQTVIERLMNGYLWSRDKKAGMFLSPPDTQYILLHPSIVIENVPDALDGNETEEGIMLEIVGMNRWRREKWYQLSGGSVVTVYSDRNAVDDLGYGLSLHFGNKFTLGAVDRDGDIGYFISLDVLELFKDKKTYLESYFGKLKFSN